ncbi:MAG: shikimate kinase [Rickettsiales bacterium]|nr:shikimate kinase [Rickettsiales bacterium]
MNKPIVLVGLMGAGKTSIGRVLARRLELPFVDLDHDIETACGCSVVDIFRLYGEPEFRRIEERVFERVLSGAPIRKVISTGEGAFITKRIRELALEKAVTVWLKADLELLEKRTSARATRPQLLAGEPSRVLSKLLDERHHIYAEANFIVETTDEPRAKTLEKVMAALCGATKPPHNG